MSIIFNKNSMKKLICLMIVTVVTLIGSLVHFGIASLYHFVIVGMIGMIIFSEKKVQIVKSSPIMMFFIFWAFEAAFSLVWSSNFSLALQYVYYILLILALCMIFHNYLTKDIIGKFAVFMVFVLFACNIIAIWETLTGNHLIKDYLANETRMRLLQYVPGTFFRNPNDFATFIIMSIPFSLLMMGSKNRLISVVATYNIAASFLSVCLAQSRTQIIILLIIYVFYIIFTKKTRLFGICIAVFFAIAVLYTIFPAFNETVDSAIASVSYDEIAASSSGGSLSTRFSLMKNGVHILYDTFGFGIGAGCHRDVMATYSNNYYDTHGVLVMHNLLVEIFVDYGLAIGIMFVACLVRSVKKLIFIYKNSEDDQTKQLAWLLALLLIIFVICGLSSSSIIQLTSLWMTLCFTSAFIEIHTREIYNRRSADVGN